MTNAVDRIIAYLEDRPLLRKTYVPAVATATFLAVIVDLVRGWG